MIIKIEDAVKVMNHLHSKSLLQARKFNIEMLVDINGCKEVVKVYGEELLISLVDEKVLIPFNSLTSAYIKTIRNKRYYTAIVLGAEAFDLRFPGINNTKITLMIDKKVPSKTVLISPSGKPFLVVSSISVGNISNCSLMLKSSDPKLCLDEGEITIGTEWLIDRTTYPQLQ